MLSGPFANLLNYERMHNNAPQFPTANSLDLFRISRAKKIADVSPNTIRKYHQEYGLRIYYCGGAAWVSRSELEGVIRAHASSKPKARKKAASAEAPARS